MDRLREKARVKLMLAKAKSAVRRKVESLMKEREYFKSARSQTFEPIINELKALQEPKLAASGFQAINRDNHRDTLGSLFSPKNDSTSTSRFYPSNSSDSMYNRKTLPPENYSTPIFSNEVFFGSHEPLDPLSTTPADNESTSNYIYGAPTPREILESRIRKSKRRNVQAEYDDDEIDDDSRTQESPQKKAHYLTLYQSARESSEGLERYVERWQPQLRNYVRWLVSGIYPHSAPALDKKFGPRVLGRNNLVQLGSKQLSFYPSVIHVGQQSYEPTLGLVELIFLENPHENHIQKHDIANYWSIVRYTSLGRVGHSERNRLQSNKSYKYRTYIAPAYKSEKFMADVLGGTEKGQHRKRKKSLTARTSGVHNQKFGFSKGHGVKQAEFFQNFAPTRFPLHQKFKSINHASNVLRKFVAAFHAGNFSLQNQISFCVNYLKSYGVIRE